jgi:hypothetical protein
MINAVTQINLIDLNGDPRLVCFRNTKSATETKFDWLRIWIEGSDVKK